MYWKNAKECAHDDPDHVHILFESFPVPMKTAVGYCCNTPSSGGAVLLVGFGLQSVTYSETKCQLLKALSHSAFVAAFDIVKEASPGILRVHDIRLPDILRGGINSAELDANFGIDLNHHGKSVLERGLHATAEIMKYICATLKLDIAEFWLKEDDEHRCVFVYAEETTILLDAHLIHSNNYYPSDGRPHLFSPKVTYVFAK
jgi:hypothetical protein